MKKLFCILFPLIFILLVSCTHEKENDNIQQENNNDTIITENITDITEKSIISRDDFSYLIDYLEFPNLTIADESGFYSNEYCIFFSQGKTIYRYDKKTRYIDIVISDERIQYYHVIMSVDIMWVTGSDEYNSNSITYTDEALPEGLEYYLCYCTGFRAEPITDYSLYQHIVSISAGKNSSDPHTKKLPLFNYSHGKHFDRSECENLNKAFSEEIYQYYSNTKQHCKEYNENINEKINSDTFDKILNMPQGSMLCLEYNKSPLYVILLPIKGKEIVLYWADEKNGEITEKSFTRDNFIKEFNLMYSYYISHELSTERKEFNEYLTIRSCPCGQNDKFFVNSRG